jgi:UDP-glucose 4-epimerase
MSIAWVIGGNGLLGSALRSAIQRNEIKLFIPTERFHWSREPELLLQLEKEVQAFAAKVVTEHGWQIYWAAGLGVMSSSEADLEIETRILSELLSLIGSNPILMATEGCFAFASSAGAIYAGAADDEVVSENTSVAPTTAYGYAKLKQEAMISEFTIKNCRVTALFARMSTLYGPGQASGKQQGLIAEIARRLLRNQPIQIYVPFDTIRDYITATDAAAIILNTMSAISGKSGSVVKIVASEQPTTIAEIISVYKRITRRKLRIVTSASKLSNIYNRRIQFHSLAYFANEPIAKTSLLVGIASVISAECFAFAQSRL